MGDKEESLRNILKEMEDRMNKNFKESLDNNTKEVKQEIRTIENNIEQKITQINNQVKDNKKKMEDMDARMYNMEKEMKEVKDNKKMSYAGAVSKDMVTPKKTASKEKITPALSTPSGPGKNSDNGNQEIREIFTRAKKIVGIKPVTRDDIKANWEDTGNIIADTDNATERAVVDFLLKELKMDPKP